MKHGKAAERRSLRRNTNSTRLKGTITTQQARLTSRTVGSELSIQFSVGCEENLENVLFYPLSSNLLQ